MSNKHLTKTETDKQDILTDINLLDCYRIALDFGMPAALRAFENMNEINEPGRLAPITENSDT